jgi:protein-tyrosine phosphatase
MPASVKRRSTARPKTNPGPSEIAPGVFVGGWSDAVRFEGTRFCVLDEAPEEMPPATHIPIYDEGSGDGLRANLDRLAREVSSARARGAPVLIFCGHGIRRSPLGGAWYLHRAEQLPLEEAFERVRAVRPKVEPPSTWMGNAASLEGA